jgi:hypothetical protein
MDLAVTIPVPARQDFIFPYLRHESDTLRLAKTGCVFTPAVWTGSIANRLVFVPFVAVYR